MKNIFAFSMLIFLFPETALWAQVTNNGCGIFIEPDGIMYIDHSLKGQSNATIVNNGYLYVTGNITNDATEDLFDKTAKGTVILNGKAQKINGKNSVTFSTLALSEYTKTASVPVSINNVLDLGNAVLLAEDQITINNEAPDAISRISGYIATQKDGELVRITSKGETGYVFPLGSIAYGSYQPVDILTQTSERSSFGMALHDFDPTYNGMNVLAKADTIDKVNDTYYYSIHRIKGVYNASIAFYTDSTREPNQTGIGTWNNRKNIWDLPYAASVASGKYGDDLNRQFIISNPTFIERDYTPVFSEPSRITKHIRIPNSFTANHDGLNEYWEIKGIEKFPNNKVVIYNRWGEVVFETTGYSSANCFKGEGVMQGVYMFVVDVNDNKGYHKTYNGDLTILR